MLEKLRRKFVALIMAILAVVLTIVFTVVCYADWQTSASETEATLQAAIEQSTMLEGPIGDHSGRGPRLGRHSNEPMATTQPRIEMAVAVYALTNSGLQYVPESRGLLSEDLDATALSSVENAPLGLGTLDGFGLVFLKADHDGSIYVAFADESLLEGWKGLALSLALIEVAILIIFFFISVAFARWALKPVETAWTKQRTFIADASHELKTPLSIIAANTSILMEEPDLPLAERNRWLESSLHAADGMKVLVEDMLDLASIDQETTDLEASTMAPEQHSLVPCDLSRMAQACVLQFESVSYERGFNMTDAIANDVHVMADQDSLRKILDILMDNACKYVNEGGTVDVSVTQDHSYARFAVTNTGAPIPPHDLEHIFDRFYRADQARTSGSGHGLGLSIAQELAKGLQAELSAQSDDERTIFALTLPLAANG